MSSSKIKVTVLMSVFNGEKYLREAIDSVLHQTFTDFEFLIINDGSTDNSVEIINSYDDERIHLVHNEQNIGLAASLNKGINLARGEYIARMDCDDINHQTRLEKQVKFMDKNPDIGLLSSANRFIQDDKILNLVDRFPTDHHTLKAFL
ncbi:MAG: glycosyltransferase family 2 protein, partial [Asgard group archaeon]|nr:glycosyltransferase family 2 protein [Asgard group archaeon]